MSKLVEQDFYFGAGLAALFKYNQGIMPSLIENVTEDNLEGKKTKTTKGSFYKLKLPNEKEIVVYIKYSDKKAIDKDNLAIWTFSFSDIEKLKIDSQRKNRVPFYVIMVCIDIFDIGNSEIAMLTEDEYLQIKNRHNIQLSLRRNKGGEVSRPKKLYVRKLRNDYLLIDRNAIENSFEDILKEKDDSIIKECEIEKEAQQLAEKLVLNIFKIPKSKCCPNCKIHMEKEYVSVTIKHLSKESIKRTLLVYRCKLCNKFFIHETVFENFTRNKKLEDISVSFKKYELPLTINKRKQEDIVKVVFLSNNLICKDCKKPLGTINCQLAIYKDVLDNKVLDKIVEEDLFYCKDCKQYYCSLSLHQTLLKKYGKNKIDFLNS